MSEQVNQPDENLVVTPGGPRPKENVHTVGAGEALRFNEAGEAAIQPNQPGIHAPEAVSATMGEDLLLTPGGFRHRSLVHQVETGQVLRVADGQLQMRDMKTNALIAAHENVIEIQNGMMAHDVLPALGSGWIAYAYWNNGTGRSITSFRTTWTVPAAPSSASSQTIFLFNGIQNYGTNYGILQPVLQWGSSAAGGGQYWSIASWYVTSGGQAFHTNLIRVNPGDVLVGVMRLTGQANGQFSYTSEFEGRANTSLPVQNIAELLWCNETLEAYSVNQCSNYPAPTLTAMRAISIQTGAVTPVIGWTAVNKVVDCGQHAVVVSNSATNGEVDIYYRPDFSNWQLLDTNAASVSITADGGNLYQMHNTGRIWKYTGTPITGWQELDNNPATKAIAASGGNLYQIHNTGRIWKYMGVPHTGWQEIDNNPASVAIVADGGNLYQLHNTGRIWKYTGVPHTGWQELDNNPATKAIAASGGYLYQIHNTGRIWKYTGVPHTGWQLIDTNPASVAIVADGGNLYQLHNSGRIWKYTGTPISGWQLLDTNPATKQIVAANGNLYQLHNTGRIWKYVGPPITGWQQLDNNAASKAIVASANNLYQIHTTGRIWKYLG